MSNLAYKRVSSVDQNLDRQLSGMNFDYVWIDRCSGSTKDRPELNRMLSESASLRKNDILHVHSIDRLARNLKDLIQIINEVNNKGVTIKFHKENMEFTKDNQNPMQNLMLQVMGACAEFERNLIKERQMEGIIAAKKKGKKFGRPVIVNDEMKANILSQVSQGIPKSKVALINGISRTKVYQVLRENI